MKISKLLAGIGLAAGLVAAQSASAVSVSAFVDIADSGQPGSVGYVAFDVTTAGRFDMYTDGPTTDPELFLFSDTNGNRMVDAGEGLIANNDDGCFVGAQSFCQPAGSFSNSLITRNLGLGAYVLATGDYNLSEAEARSGINNSGSFGTRTGEIEVTISGDRFRQRGGVAAIAPVPLPAAGWMLLAGLGGMAAMRRRAKA